MYTENLKHIKNSLDKASEKKGLDELSSSMFDRFFEMYPEAASHFEDQNIKTLARSKFDILTDYLMDTLRYPDYVEMNVSSEVKRHLMNDVRDKEYYFALVDALHDVIKDSLASEWTSEIEESWQYAIVGMKHTLDNAVKLHRK